MKLKLTIYILFGSLGLISLLLCLFLYVLCIHPGFTPKQSMDILVKDAKFGSRSLWLTKLYGDNSLKYLHDISIGYSKLNNVEYISELLSSINSQKSIEISEEMYESDFVSARLIGAYSLMKHGRLNHNKNHFLNHFLEDDISYNDLSLLIKVIIESKDPNALGYLIRLQKSKYSGHQLDTFICEAMGELGDKKAIPYLETLFMDRSFYSFDCAFDSLLKLEANKIAIQQAILRMENDYPSDIPRVRRSLERVQKKLKKFTGQDFGYDYKQWMIWWRGHFNG